MRRQCRDDSTPGAITPRGRHTDHVTATAKQQAEPSRMVAHCQGALGDPAEAERLIALSDERDQWQRACLARERAAYERGLNDGRAAACVFLAEMERHREAIAWWREWSARLRRIIQNDADPSVRMNQVMAEIAADQKFMREARKKRATNPGTLSPLEACVLRRIRLEDPGDPL